MTTATKEGETLTVDVRMRYCETHPNQKRLVESTSKRLIVKAGRRGGKTVGAAIKAVNAFLAGKRVLYATPTDEQKGKFWFEVKRALGDLCQTNVYKLNETEHYIEKVSTENRLKARTAWNPDMLRGDYTELLILDEYQLMNEKVWEDAGQPLLLDKNGDAVIIFTPPSLKMGGTNRSDDPRHASKLFKAALEDTTGLWETIHFTSHDNPYISHEALQIITQDMSLDSYRREIMAQDDEIETSWLVHSKFNETLCKVKRFTIPLNWDVYSGHDFGSANPACLFIARCKLPLPDGAPAYMRQGDMIIFREYAPGPGYSMGQHVDRFKEIAKGYTVLRSRGGNLNSEDEIRQGYTVAGWTILPPALEKKNSQIDRMIAIEEGNKLYVLDDLWMVLSEISNCMWKLDKENRPTNEIDNGARYHLSSCLRYIGSDRDFKPEIVSSIKQSVKQTYRM